MPKALVISFFPAFTPPTSGGELRLCNLYRSLSASFELTLLTSTDFGARFEEINHTNSFRELRFPKDELWRNAYRTLEGARVSGDLAGLAFALAVADPACGLRKVARELAPSVDLVIHEFPFSEPIFADGSAPLEIYNSHNFETSLLSSIVQGPGLDDAFAKLVRLEQNLTRRAKLVFATSQADLEKFRLFYGVPAARLGLCPNGYDEDELRPVSLSRNAGKQRLADRPQLLFTGSQHHPNVEAATWLAHLAHELPECDVVVAGGVSRVLKASQQLPNFHCLGSFDAARKLALLEQADLYLNPVILGSGTSLKAIEALGAGLPMVSTPEGVRGLHLEDGVHAAVVPRSDFPEAVRALLADADYRARCADRGREWVVESYSWERIAHRLAEQLARPASRRQVGPSPRPLALALNDFAVPDTSSGGKARIFHLHANLDLDIIFVSFGPTYDFALVTPGRLHITVPKTPAHEAFEASMNAGQRVSVNDIVASLFAATNQSLACSVADLACRASVVIFEHTYMAPLLDVIRLVRPDLPVVYSAHNVEKKQKTEILTGHRLGRTLSRFVGEVEQRLVEASALVVCCTEVDAEYFATHGAAAVVVAANGCTVPDAEELAAARELGRRNGKRRQKRVAFLGSSHPPNVEASQFIVTELAPAFPDLEFELIGGVCSAIEGAVPDNVLLYGEVSETVKRTILAGCDVALNPLQSGGGSSLKLPDYLAHRLATLSTLVGARGFAIEQNKAGRVVERHRFREALSGLFANRRQLEEQRVGAYRYAADALSWKAVTKAYRTSVKNILAPPTAQARQRSLLVVTYRYTEPPLGGAEEYLIEVLDQLRPRFDRIDLAAVDVGSLSNHHHFGCRFSQPHPGPSRILGSRFDHVALFEAETVSDPITIATSRRLERVWSREELELYLPFLKLLTASGRTHLLSGFYWPEYHSGVVRRWTSPEFWFVTPPNARVFKFAGWSPRHKTLTMTLMRVPEDGPPVAVAECSRVIGPGFSESFALPTMPTFEPALLRCVVEEHQVENDHRPFGLLLEAAAVLHAVTHPAQVADAKIEHLAESHVDLTEEHERRFREENFEQWVETLVRLARARSDEVETDFAMVRGPHSPAMQGWLAENAERYDTVLVQGIPFDLIPSTVATLRTLREPPRIVTLPHFHSDDRFYYWRRYLDSFEAADQTLLFSGSINRIVGASDRFRVIPGGGVSPTEYADVASRHRFAQVHKREAPFFLVLGRKTASKGYEQVMRAHRALRDQGAKVELVLIGPDEDGIPIHGDGVHYLGQQPREVVLGALAECLAIVTMSSSESFGIVLCEAWMSGKPVIANRACYSFRELVKDGETGLLVRTTSDLVTAMERLATNPTERDRMGRAGRAEATSRYTWGQVASEVYDALVIHESANARSSCPSLVRAAQNDGRYKEDNS